MRIKEEHWNKLNAGLSSFRERQIASRYCKNRMSEEFS